MLQELEQFHSQGVCRYYRKDSRVVVVWFGGINEPFFSESFAEYCPFDCLYFRDTSQDWYTFGLQAAMCDRENFVRLLSDLHQRYEYVAFCGQSSGGYAALYYGLRAEAQLCLVFAPQTQNFHTGQNMIVPAVKLEDIASLYETSASHPTVIINVSRSERDHAHEFEWQDQRQIERLRTLSRVTIVTHPYDNHAISILLRKQGVLYKYVVGTVRVYCYLYDVKDKWD